MVPFWQHLVPPVLVPKQLILVVLQQTVARNLNLRDKEAAAEACSSALALRSPGNQDGLRDWAPEKKLMELRASKHSICEGISALMTGFGMAECA